MQLRELDGGLPVAGLAHDVVPLLDEHLGEVEPDQRLVLGDHHAPYGGALLSTHGHRLYGRAPSADDPFVVQAGLPRRRHRLGSASLWRGPPR